MKRNIFLLLLTIFTVLSFASCKNPSLDPSDMLGSSNNTGGTGEGDGGGGDGGGSDGDGSVPATFKSLAASKTYGKTDNETLSLTTYSFNEDARELTIIEKPDYFALATTAIYTYDSETSNLVATYKNGGDTKLFKLVEGDVDKLLESGGTEIANTATTAVSEPSFISGTKGQTFKSRNGLTLNSYEVSASGNTITYKTVLWQRGGNINGVTTTQYTHTFKRMNGSSAIFADASNSEYTYSLSSSKLQKDSTDLGIKNFSDPGPDFLLRVAGAVYTSGSDITYTFSADGRTMTYRKTSFITANETYTYQGERAGYKNCAIYNRTAGGSSGSYGYTLENNNNKLDAKIWGTTWVAVGNEPPWWGGSSGTATLP